MQSQQPKFYDLITTGMGFVSRIRPVTGKRKGAKPSLYCKVSVPLGPDKDCKWTSIDCRVCGVETVDLINSLKGRVAQGTKPAINFSIGDIYGDAFEYGDDLRAQFKGRLIRAELPARDEPQKPFETSGLAYVNDVAGGTVKLSAIHGPEDDINHVAINVSEVAESVSNSLVKAWANKEDRVLINFVVKGIAVDPVAAADGELDTEITAKDLRVKWVRVNGQVVPSEQPVSNHQVAEPDAPPKITEPNAPEVLAAKERVATMNATQIDAALAFAPSKYAGEALKAVKGFCDARRSVLVLATTS
jgi:hypothetical protein